MRFLWKVLRESGARFAAVDAPTYAAALAYSMVFSLPPMLLIILWAAGLFYKEMLVSQAVFSEIGALVGEEGARQLMVTLEGLHIQEPTLWATAVAAVALVLTASTVLVNAQNALNRVFRVKAVRRTGLGIWQMARDRFVSFAMLVTIAFILSVSLVLESLIALFAGFLEGRVGAASWLAVLEAALLDLGALTLVFAMLFRYLPDVQLPWRDTWFGAFLTAGAFAVGKDLIGFLIGRSDAADLYEAAGSVLVLMLWVYYASVIFLFGAALTVTRLELSGASGAGTRPTERQEVPRATG